MASNLLYLDGTQVTDEVTPSPTVVNGSNIITLVNPDKIFINFAGGAHGHYVQELIDMSYSESYLPIPITGIGTWHNIQQFSLSKIGHGWMSISDGHIVRNPYIISNRILTISVTNQISTAMFHANWFRTADRSYLSMHEIVGMTKQEFIDEWNYRKQTEVLADMSDMAARFTKIREKTLAKIIYAVYKDSNVATEGRVITFRRNTDYEACKFQHNANRKWLATLPSNTKIVEVEMSDLYNTQLTINLVNRIEQEFNIRKRCCTDTDIMQMVEKFRKSVTSLPDIQLVEELFNKWQLGIDADLTSLTFNDKNVLWLMIKNYFYDRGINSISDVEFDIFPNRIAELINITLDCRKGV